MNGTFYLNNSGSRWIILENGCKPKVKVLFPDDHIEERTVLFFESFGNFAVIWISLKGKKQSFFQDTKGDENGKTIFQGIILK